jgi:hypothetical protein
MTRARYRQQGWMFHPDFFSVYSDNWFTDCAMMDDVVIFAKHIHFEHLHPCFGRAEVDATYQRGNSESAYRMGYTHYKRLLERFMTSYDVEGWCNYREFYSRCAEKLPMNGTFVELGSWLGQSIIHLAQRCQDRGNNVKIVCVDTFKGEEGQAEHVETVKAHGGSIQDAFMDNILKAGVHLMITPIVGDSAESASKFSDSSIHGVFVDAAHDYESVKRDLEAWYPKLAPGAIWSGHDYGWREVKRAVDEHASENGYEVAETIGNVWHRV